MFVLQPIGHVRSPLTSREQAPKQGDEDAPTAWLEFLPAFEAGLRDLQVGDEILLLTWLDHGQRETLSVHPRDDLNAPLRGVFSTRSQDRPNPVGLHRVTLAAKDGPLRYKALHLEAFDGTPIIDVKPVLDRLRER